MSDNAGAAGAAQDDAGQQGSQTQGAGAQAANANDGQQGAATGATQTPSANKLIKDFADSRGVTVSALLDQFTQMENAGKTELQKLSSERDTYKTRFDELSGKYRTAIARSAVTDAATKANAIDAGAVFAIVRDDLEYGENDEPTNLDAVLKEAKAKHPALFRAANGSADGGKGGGPATNAGSFNDVIRELARTAT